MRKLTLLSASLLAVAYSQAAVAQEETERGRSASSSGEIVVTATKLATNVQDVPIAITAVTSETLEARNLTSSADLGAIVPNATFRQTEGSFGKGLSAFMRGVGQGDTGFAAEPGVAFYIDDAYYPLIHGSIFDLLDLDHVEVLRGPQGTLFGRNSIAGAINLVSKEPNQDPSAYVNITAGSRERIDVRAGFNVPLTETLALRVSGFTKNQKGFQKRLDFRCEMIRRGTPKLAGTFPFTGGEHLTGPNGNDEDACVTGRVGGTEAHGVRGAIKWEPVNNLAITIIGDYTKDTSSVQADDIISIDPARGVTHPGSHVPVSLYTPVGGPAFLYDERFITGDPYKSFATNCDPTPAGATIPGSLFYNGSITRGGVCYDPVNPVKIWGVTGKVVYGITDQIEATLIAGYRRVDVGYTFDVDQSPLNLELTRNITYHKQKTLEARLSGRMDWIDWVVGAFYYKADENEVRVIISPFSNVQRYRNDFYEPQNKSVYANATIRPFGERFSINLGGRYSDDEKPLSFDNRQDGNPAGDIVFDQVLSTERFDWKLGASYEFSDDVMVYASAATGYRLPTFNSRPFQPSQVFQIPGDDLISYDVGFKADFFDRRLRVNGAAFYTDYKQRSATVSGSEYQIGNDGTPVPGSQVTIPLPGGPDGSTTCRNLTPDEISNGVPGFLCIPRAYPLNVPGEVIGFELELRAEPIDNLTIDGSFGYAKFDSPDLKTPTRITDRLLGIPDFNASAGIQYVAEIPALAGRITPRLDWFYTGTTDYSVSRPELNGKRYSVFNARVTYDNEPTDFSISLSATNLFNKFYYVSYFDLSGFGFPQTNAQPAEPREFAVTLSKRF